MSGDRDTSLPLEIIPTADPITTERDAYNDGTIAFIQRMPVTKRVDRVTLGDLGVGSSCASGTALQLFVREHPNGSIDDSNQITYSPAHASLPTAPGKVTWGIPATTLRKGRGYSFKVAFPQGCRFFKHVSWAHESPPVNAGPASCATGPRLDPSESPIRKRMYHVLGAYDASSACVSLPPSNPAFFDTSMPTGWLMTTGTYVLSGTNWPSEPSVATVCGTGTESTGARVVRWRASPGKPDGYYDYVCMWSPLQYGIPGSLQSAGWFYGLPWLRARNGAPRDAYMKLETIDYDALLAKHAPLLKYDSQELYFADSASTITDNFVTGGELESNVLRDGPLVLAAANPSLGSPTLSLDFLRAGTYPSGLTALASDYLDERDAYQEDASRLHANPAYANRAYGRVIHDDATGALWLQYWYFYYYNPQNLLGVGNHEGDWEMVQIRLGPTLVPERATFARHGNAARCGWSAVHRAPDNVDSPVVYVANGSHAAYFAPGDYDRGELLPNDVAHGLGFVARPSLTTVDNTYPGWVMWPGSWGDGGSPPSPGKQGVSWDDPEQFDVTAGTNCTVGSGGQAAYPSRSARSRRNAIGRYVRPRPRAPTVTARRRGQRVVVRYRVRGLARSRSRRPFVLVVTVHPSERHFAPRGHRVRLRRSSGDVKLSLPLGSAPYHVRASVVRRDGVRSRVVYRRVRG